MENWYDVGQRSGSAGMEEGILPLLALNPKQVTPNKEKMIGLQVKTRGKYFSAYQGLSGILFLEIHKIMLTKVFL